MPITLDDPTTPGYPVIKRTALGQRFIGALVRYEQQDMMKRDDRTGELRPVPKGDTGKNRQELVLTLVTMPGTNAPAGLGDNTAVPAPGDIVRSILRGQSFAEWIQAKRDHGGGVNVGDVVEQTTTHAQAYQGPANPVGPKLTNPAAIDAVDLRTNTLGYYGPLTLRRPNPDETQWVTAAEAAYHNTRTVIPAGVDPDDVF